MFFLWEILEGIFSKPKAMAAIKKKLPAHGEHKGPPKPAGAKPPAPHGHGHH